MYGSLIYVSHCNHTATTISTTTGTGTTQGQSGWYMDFDGEVYYFAVDMYETLKSKNTEIDDIIIKLDATSIRNF